MKITITLTETDKESLGTEFPELHRLWSKLVSDEKELKLFQERISEAIEVFMMQARIGWGEGFEVAGFQVEFGDNLRALN